jgi:SagB-type dehydrogenase family enzyme
MLETAVQCVLRYHEQTKHHLNRYARSLGYLDWATQPDPFRRFDGAPQIPLDHPPPSPELLYDALFTGQPVSTGRLDRHAISRLFYDSLAISAWKQAPGAGRWSLRVNPSSGALHPTEGYLLTGTVEGLGSQPAVYHYSPYAHALEQRVALSGDEWASLTGGLPAGAVLVALTSIHWRESWKYGERAFRYCHHDVGHAIGSITFAAATLGCEARLVTSIGQDALAALLGTNRQQTVRMLGFDAMLAVFPRGDSYPARPPAVDVPTTLLERLATSEFAGSPNRLSESHHHWPVIDEVARATHVPVDETAAEEGTDEPPSIALPGAPINRPLPAQQIIRQRRSAVDMDGRTSLPRETFYRMMARVSPHRGFPFAVLPWPPCVALAIFVHRVADLSPGLYLLVRSARHERLLRDALKPDFLWRRPAECPDDLQLWCLMEADCGSAARTISCHQSIASEGAFSLGMMADFEPSLRHRGAWFYPRLFWETGLIGQVLYLEAEAAGMRGTGIGCFFDDAMHDLLGIRDRSWQSLYHFTVGGPTDDLRLQTLPPYEHLPLHDVPATAPTTEGIAWQTGLNVGPREPS